MGRHLSWEQRVRWASQIDPDPTRQPLPARRSRRGRHACAQNPSTYLGARYRRIATRRGPQKANVAVQHSILTAIWHMGHTGELYNDPGADVFARLHPERAKKRALHQLEAMGYRVSLDRVS